jgi:citrate/tricarballylate utilization protein
VLAAAWQHVLGVLPPYRFLSAPVLTGVLGGVAMIVGCTGLMYLKVRAPNGFLAANMLTIDFAFLAILNLASITGMLTLGLRGTPWMGPMLVAHMSSLVGLYATAPYGKFVHSVYRVTALLIDAVERRDEHPELNPESL